MNRIKIYEEKKDDLSISKIVKNSFENIKKKKYKFIFTVLIIVLTFISIIIYDIILNYKDPIIKDYAQLLLDKKQQFIQVEKSDFYYKNEMTMDYKVLTEEDVKQINQRLKQIGKTGEAVYRIANLHIESNNIIGYSTSIYDLLEINPEFRTNSNPYTYWNDEFDIIEWNNLSDFFVNDIIGKIPANNDEIMISNYLADLLLAEGLKPYGEDNYYSPASYEELVNSNKFFNFGVYDKVKIVGIINYDLLGFQSLNNISWDEYNSNLEKYNCIFDELYYNNKTIYNKIFVNNEFINNLNVNDESKSNNVWENKVIKVGVLVLENTKDGFERLLNEFKYDEPITAQSSYSELLDVAMEITDTLPDMSLISSILFYYVIFLVILSIMVISKFLLSKQELNELSNHREKRLYIKETLLSNIIIIEFISVLLSLIILMCFIHYFKTFVVGDNAILNNVFALGTRQFTILFLSIVGIGMISYLILKVRIKIAYKINN